MSAAGYGTAGGMNEPAFGASVGWRQRSVGERALLIAALGFKALLMLLIFR